MLVFGELAAVIHLQSGIHWSVHDLLVVNREVESSMQGLTPVITLYTPRTKTNWGKVAMHYPCSGFQMTFGLVEAHLW
jgi:hypothetical protein